MNLIIMEYFFVQINKNDVSWLMKCTLYKYDLPSSDLKGDFVAIDTETMGLNLTRDRLCCVQLMINNEVFLVHFPEPIYNKSPNLVKFLGNDEILKIFHFARFDMLSIYKYLGVLMKNVVCTRVLSKIVRTFTDKHSLKELCKEKLDVDLNKSKQTSNWGAIELTQAQIDYAAHDVIYLNELFQILKRDCIRENRYHIAESIFQSLPHVCLVESCNFDPCLLFNH